MLGGEQSGHVIFREHATTGDGLLTAVRFLSLAAANGVSVGELARAMLRYPQVMINVPVSDRGAAVDAARWSARSPAPKLSSATAVACWCDPPAPSH